MTQKLYTLCAALLASCVGAAAQSLVSGFESDAVQYERYDAVLQADNASSIDALLTLPDGGCRTLPLFKDFDGLWKMRLAPTVPGTWKVSFAYDGIPADCEWRFECQASDSKGFLHTRDFWTLAFDDGTPFRGIGSNLCWESRTFDDSKYFKELHEDSELFSYSRLLPRLKENGGNFTRMWMCSWNFPIDRKADFNNRRYSPSEGPLNESAVLHLDETIELAQSLGIEIMLCMGQGDVTANAAFFTEDAPKQTYRERLRYIVARWGYSTAVGMWEFFNEIDNIQFKDSKNPIPAEYIVAWHDEMSRYLKSIDPYDHIVTTSISHRDLAGLNALECIDINQKHMYRCVKDIPRTIKGYEAKYGKPYVIGEAGYEWDWSKNFDDFADGMDMDYRRELWYGVFNPTPVAPMSWWWEYFQNRNTDRYIKAVRTVSEQMLCDGGGCFEQLDAKGGDAYAVRCGKTVYLYVYNNTDTIVNSASVSGVKARKVWQFDPATLEWERICGLKKLGIEPLGEGIYKITR